MLAVAVLVQYIGIFIYLELVIRPNYHMAVYDDYRLKHAKQIQRWHANYSYTVWHKSLTG